MPAVFKATYCRTMTNFWTYLIIYEIYIILSTNTVVSSSKISHLVKRSDPENTPRILSSPSQLSVLEGDTVIFPCRTDNTDKFIVMWRKGKNKLLYAGAVSADNDKTFKLTNKTYLQINSVTEKYAGEYTCHINSEPPIELTHVLHVLVAPKISLDPPDAHIFVEKGDKILAKCNAKGYPKPIITWTAIRGTLPGGLKERQGETLEIPSADIYHTGEYVCKADNEVGKPGIAKIWIKVSYAPEVNVSPIWVHAGLGSDVSFRCVGSAEPPATLYWTRMPNTLLTESENVHLQQLSKSSAENISILKISRLTKDKFGSYSCYANNSVGSAFRKVEISGLAEAVKFRSNVSGEEETSFLLSWSVKSYNPIIEYLLRIRQQKNRESSSSSSSWNDVMIPAEIDQSVHHTHSYNITGLEEKMSYEVVMQARNDFGWNHPSETFTFYTLGGEPLVEEKEDITIKVNSNDNIILPGASLQTESNDDEPESQSSHSNRLQFYKCLFFITTLFTYIRT